ALQRALPATTTPHLAITLAADRSHDRLLLALDEQVIDAVPCTVDREDEGTSTQADDLGAGLFLVRRLMDEVDYIPAPGANRWRLARHLPDGALAAPDALTMTFDIPA